MVECTLGCVNAFRKAGSKISSSYGAPTKSAAMARPSRHAAKKSCMTGTGAVDVWWFAPSSFCVTELMQPATLASQSDTASSASWGCSEAAEKGANLETSAATAAGSAEFARAPRSRAWIKANIAVACSSRAKGWVWLSMVTVSAGRAVSSPACPSCLRCSTSAVCASVIDRHKGGVISCGHQHPYFRVRLTTVTVWGRAWDFASMQRGGKEELVHFACRQRFDHHIRNLQLAIGECQLAGRDELQNRHGTHRATRR